jgi:hypothetical protein
MLGSPQDGSRTQRSVSATTHGPRPASPSRRKGAGRILSAVIGYFSFYFQILCRCCERKDLSARQGRLGSPQDGLRTLRGISATTHGPRSVSPSQRKGAGSSMSISNRVARQILCHLRSTVTKYSTTLKLCCKSPQLYICIHPR